MRYKVYPDYQSTGFWVEGVCNCEVPDYFPDELKIAIKYWHYVWELTQDHNCESVMSKMYKEEWNEDGKKLVNLMNRISTDLNKEDTFHYVED